MELSKAWGSPGTEAGWLNGGIAFNPLPDFYLASVCGVESSQLGLLSKKLSVVNKPRLWHCRRLLSVAEPAPPEALGWRRPGRCMLSKSCDNPGALEEKKRVMPPVRNGAFQLQVEGLLKKILTNK